MILLHIVIWFFATIGHVGIWCVAFNRTHATALPRKWRKVMERIVILAVVVPSLMVLWNWILAKHISMFTPEFKRTSLLYGYCLGCLCISPFFVINWILREFFLEVPLTIKSKHRELVDIQALVGKKLLQPGMPSKLGKVPGNQATKLMLETIEFQFKSLPKALDGLRIAHLSDIHLTGHLAKDYFEKVSELATQHEPDLILITGDLVDEHDCLDWIPDIFGKLKAKHGVYYVMGNHDMRIKDQDDLRKRLADTGLIAIDGRWLTLRINGVPIALAGNSIPWYPDAEKLPFDPPDGGQFRILLSHSPDQLDWAKPFMFDLMLAGHTHGGQVQLPLIGPIVAPSKYGVRYSHGAFQLEHMFMYVSRGISGDKALRINCPPELGLFTLRKTKQV